MLMLLIQHFLSFSIGFGFWLIVSIMVIDLLLGAIAYRHVYGLSHELGATGSIGHLPEQIDLLIVPTENDQQIAEVQFPSYKERFETAGADPVTTLTKKALQEMAKDAGIKGYSRMNKAQLQAAICADNLAAAEDDA